MVTPPPIYTFIMGLPFMEVQDLLHIAKDNRGHLTDVLPTHHTLHPAPQDGAEVVL